MLVALLIIFKIPTKLFCWSNKIIFGSVSSKILGQNRSFRIYVKTSYRDTRNGLRILRWLR